VDFAIESNRWSYRRADVLSEEELRAAGKDARSGRLRYNRRGRNSVGLREIIDISTAAFEKNAIEVH
jgi:hypothetical protein